MPSWFPLVVAIAAVGLMYLCCIRPMRRGACGPAGRTEDDAEDSSRRAEVDRLRTEIADARRNLANGSPSHQAP